MIALGSAMCSYSVTLYLRPIVELENQLKRKIKPLQFDRCEEYFSNKFSKFVVEHVIMHERTLSYSPKSNGIAKRKNHTLT